MTTKNSERKATPEQMAEFLAEALLPMARAFIGCTPQQQIALAEWIPVRCSHLRDAYLALSKYEQWKNTDRLSR